MFCRVPGWFLGFYMMYQIGKVIWKRRSLPFQVLVLCIGFIIAWMVLKQLMEFQIYIPERLIPTKWSDFSFWVEKYNDIQKHMEKITYITPTLKDVIYLRYTKRCIYYSLFSFAGMCILVTHKKVFFRENGCISKAFLAVVLECAALFILFKTGKVFQVTKGFLCIIPLFIISLDIAKRVKDYIRSFIDQ